MFLQSKPVSARNNCKEFEFFWAGEAGCVKGGWGKFMNHLLINSPVK